MYRYSLLFILIIPFISLAQGTINEKTNPTPFFENLWGPTGKLHHSVPKIELIQATGDTKFVHPRRLNKAVYSPDDKTIIATAREYVAGWEAETGILKWHYKFLINPNTSSLCAAIKMFKTKPWVVVGNYNGQTVILNYETGKEIRQLKRLSQWVMHADLSPEEDHILVSGIKGEFFLWDLKNEKEIPLNYIPEAEKIYTSKFSNTGKYFILCGKFSGNNGFAIYNLHAGTYELFSSYNHQAGYSAAFSEDDQFVALGYFDGGLDFRTAIGGELMWSLDTLQPRTITKIDFINKGKTIVASAPRSLLKINVATGKHTILNYAIDDQDHIDDFAFNSDQSRVILITRNDHRLQQYSYPKLKPISWNIGLANGIAEHLLFSPDGKYLVTGGDGSGKITFWNTADQKIYKTLKDGYLSDASVIRFSPDGKQLAILWKPKYTLENRTPELTMTAYSWPDLKVLATNSKIPAGTMEFCFLDKNRLAVFGHKWVGNYVSFPELEIKHSLNFQTDYLEEMGEELLVNLWGYRYSNILHWLNKRISRYIMTPVSPDPENGRPYFNQSLFGGFSKESKLYAAIDTQQILYVYNRINGATLTGIPIKDYFTHKLAFSPTKRMIVVVGNDTLLHWYKVKY